MSNETNLLDWIINNKEWLFSGIGVVVLGGIAALIRRRKSTSTPLQKQKSGHHSSSVQIGGDINITTTAVSGKNLDSHQQAYSLIKKLLKNLHKEDLWQTVVQCQNWWDENCLFLGEKSQDAFFKAFKGAMIFSELSNQIDEEREEKKNIFDQLHAALETIAQESGNSIT